MVRFPARKFAWSALADLPKVGALAGSEAESGTHFQLLDGLLDRLEEEHGVEAVMGAPIYGGWVEVRNGIHRVAEEPGDGYVSGLASLAPTARATMVEALARWAEQAGVVFDRRLPRLSADGTAPHSS